MLMSKELEGLIPLDDEAEEAVPATDPEPEQLLDAKVSAVLMSWVDAGDGQKLEKYVVGDLRSFQDFADCVRIEMRVDLDDALQVLYALRCTDERYASAKKLVAEGGRGPHRQFTGVQLHHNDAEPQTYSFQCAKDVSLTEISTAGICTMGITLFGLP